MAPPVRRALPLLVLLAGCGEPVDPLADTRTAWQLQAAETSRDWPAHAVLVLDHAETAQLGLDALKVPETIALQGPMGLPLVVRPTITAVEASSQPAEGDGVLMTGTAEASLGVQIPPFVNISGLPVTIALAAQLDLRVTNGRLVIELADPESIDATTTFGTLPRQIAALADGLLDGWLEDQAAQALTGGLALGPTPQLGPIAVLDARLLPGDDLTIALRLPSATAGSAALPPTIEGGWGLAVDLDAVLQASRVLALQQPPSALYVFEPLAIDIAGDAVTLDMRWHRRSRASKWRDLRAHATLMDDGEAVRPRLDGLDNVQHEQWPGQGPMGIVLKKACKRLDALELAVPHVIELAELDREAVWEDWAVEGDDLVVRGTLVPMGE